MPRSSSVPVSTTRASKSATRRPLLEACEPRQLFALVGPDLVGAGISLSQDPMPGSGSTVDVNFSIKNNGGLFGDAGGFWVTFWESRQNPLDEYISTGRLGDVYVPKLDNGKTYSGTFTINTQSTNDNNRAYVLMEIDSRRAQGEWDEGNNFRYAEGKDFVSYRSEGDLAQDLSTDKPTLGRGLGMNGQLEGTIGDESVGTKDLDIFDTNVVSGTHYMVDLDRVTGSNLDSYVRVYDQDWNLVTENDNGRDENETSTYDAYAEFTAGSSGTYHFVVSNTFNHNSDPRLLSGRDYSYNFMAAGGYTISVHNIADRPIVNLSVIDSATTEGSSTDRATVRVSRSGSPDKALNVNWNLGGTASINDYSLSGNGTTNYATVVIPAGQQYVDVQVTALDDGTWEPSETLSFSTNANNSYYVGVGGSATVNLLNAASDRPRVLGSQDIFTDNNGQRVVFNFDDSLGTSLDAGDFSLYNADTKSFIAADKFNVTWNESDRTAVVRFTGFTNGVLPNANYQLTLYGSGFTNAGGLSMSSNWSQSFFSLAGDLNRDHKVDFADLVKLAQNYNSSGKLPSEGNANGDPSGKVDFADLVVLARNYNKSLQSIAYLIAPASASVSTSPFSSTLIPNDETKHLAAASKIITI